MLTTRRQILSGTVSGLMANLMSKSALADDLESPIELIDEDTRGQLGERDLIESGMDVRAAKQSFVFPDDANDNRPYGIDVSHHIKDVPWTALQVAKCQYVYVKATQSTRGVDGWFEKHWKGAYEVAALPVGGYHFLSPGRTGRAQAEFFLSKLQGVGGLNKGRLQPVVDLEWDTYGPEFNRTPVGKDKNGKTTYKDYWVEVSAKDIVQLVQECVDTIRAASKNTIVPLVYTNRTWWTARLGSDARLKNCKIWISDYRKESYKNQQPRSVDGHEYSLWQFSESGSIRAGGRIVKPVDCNKLVSGSVDDMLIT